MEHLAEAQPAVALGVGPQVAQHRRWPDPSRLGAVGPLGYEGGVADGDLRGQNSPRELVAPALRSLGRGPFEEPPRTPLEKGAGPGTRLCI
jgi:hypothetical protein